MSKMQIAACDVKDCQYIDRFIFYDNTSFLLCKIPEKLTELDGHMEPNKKCSHYRPKQYTSEW